MSKPNRKSQTQIEKLESRTHFTVSLGSTPTDLGDLTSIPLTQKLVHANSSGLPDEFTFTVTQQEKVTISTAARPHSVVSLRLEDDAGNVAFANPRRIEGVISAGQYELFARISAGSKYMLVVKTSPTTDLTDLFPTSEHGVTPNGWAYMPPAATPDLAPPLLFPSRALATVSVDDIWWLSTPGYVWLTAKIHSSDRNDLSVIFLDSSGQAYTTASGHNPNHVLVNGDSYVEVINASAIGLPIAFHLSLSAKEPRSRDAGLVGSIYSGVGYSSYSDPSSYPDSQALALELTGQSAGWNLSSGFDATDNWVFTGDGKGVRTISLPEGQVTEPFSWAWTTNPLDSNVSVTFDAGVVETLQAVLDSTAVSVATASTDAPIGTLTPG